MARPLEVTSVAGGILRTARMQTGLSQRELAARAGVAQSMIAAYETGKREPTMPTLLKLLNAADLDLRMHLVPLDDHDRVLAATWETWPEEHRRNWEEYVDFMIKRNRERLREAKSARHC